MYTKYKASADTGEHKEQEQRNMDNKPTKKERGQVPPDFGADMREQEFSLKTGEVLLNNGSWGTLPSIVLEASIQHIRDCESDPDAWYGVNRTALWELNLRAIASALGATYENVQFVENVSRGLSNILKSIPFPEGGTILGNTWLYPSVSNCGKAVRDAKEGVDYVDITYSVPIDKDSLLQTFTAALDANPNTKIALIDHISYYPTVVFPVQEMVQECRNRGVLSLVDGAHVPGHIDLNIESLNCDFYLANLTKWMFATKGSSVMWVAPPYQDQVRSAVQSITYMSSWPADMFHQGTRYDSVYMTTRDSLDFVEWIGGLGAITTYCKGLVDQGSQEMANAWETQTMQISAELETPFMRMIMLPDLPNYPKEYGSRYALMGDLRARYNISVQVFFFNQELWVRVCGQIYVTMADMNALRDAILELKDEEPTEKRKETDKQKKPVKPQKP